MPYPFARNERLFSAVETTYGIVPAIGNNNAMRHNQATMANNREAIQPGYKTGTRSTFTFVKGRRSATWEVTADMFTSGAAGVVPDADPLFQSLFWLAPTAGGGSVVYSFGDCPPVSISLAKFHEPCGGSDVFNHKICLGAVASDAEFTIGQNIAYMRLSGRGLAILEKDHFGTADVAEKGGLGGFPSEPGAPVYNGSSITGFVGAVTLDGSSIPIDLVNAAIRVRSGNALVDNAFNNYYPVRAEGDARVVTVSFALFDSDAAATKNVRNKALSQTPIAVSLQVGDVAGNIVTWDMPKVVLSQPTIQEQRSLILNFADCLCLSSSQTLKDEMKMTLT